MQKIDFVPRRTFLAHLVSSSAFVLGARAGAFDYNGATTAELVSDADKAAWNPNVYLGIEPDGKVILIMHRSEMGTGSRSVLPMVMAEELDADWKRITLEQAIGDPKYGSQNTDGSCSIRDFYDVFREAGATARIMLERAAAAKWKVPTGECKAQNHFVVHKSGKKLGFGELATLAKQQPVPKKEELKFKTPAEYRYVGKELPTADRDNLVNGKGIFGIDATMPGMVYASIERSPVFGGKLKSVDDKDAKTVKGVIQTVTIPDLKGPTGFQPLGGVAVIANSTWAAAKGREKLKVEWSESPNAAYDSAKFKQSLLETVRKPQKVVRNVGDVDAEFAKATKTHEAEYYAPHLAHAPMEPVAAVAEYKDGKVVCHANTQNPQAVQDTVAQALGIDKKNVECHVTLLGGGFGRKSKPDYVAEAALLSKAVGKPVKVTWSREDDIRFDYYHTVAAMYMKAAIGANGKPTAWLQRVAYPSIGTTFNPASTHAEAFEMMMGWNDVPFDIPNHRAENGPAKNHVRIGWLRSVANIYQAFAIHSFVDELANLAKRDSVEYLLDVLGSPRKIALGKDYINHGKSQEQYPVDTGRMRNVIELAAEKSGWAKRKPTKGRALGIAAHRSFLSYIAAVVDLEVDNAGKVKIHRVDIAADAGTIISPDRVRAQFEGASVFGASIALMSEITATNGVINQSNFHDYQVARMNEAPYATHVHIVKSDAPPAGVGEPGVPPMMPAICNAIAAATGKRIRSLPIKRQLA
ncbi:MAG TPA: molybdopterin cofactor-binding domain-containing protein [Blastocatellia bacterium]|nr:molybdopterin cofactor-binding domain-containing protein [Blastocatellia bacterium]